METSLVRCPGTWIYESTSFLGKTTTKEVPGMLEFHLEHFPHPEGVKSLTSSSSSSSSPDKNNKTFGQCSPNSKIVLFNSGVPPPGSGKNEKFQKAVTKERADATKCEIKFYELVNVHIIEDQVAKYGQAFAQHELAQDQQQQQARRRIERFQEEQNEIEANSVTRLEDKSTGSTTRGMGDRVVSGLLSADQTPEDTSPLTLAITFCVRAPGATKVRGTEDIFGTPAERQDSSHPLRSIKFVVQAIAATGGERITGGDTPYKSLHDRFVDRVLHPIESFLLPEGKLHIFPIVSPVSGQGKGVKLYTDAQKIFRRSHHVVHPAIITKYRGHAEDWVANSSDFFFPLDPSLPATTPQPQTAARSVIIPFGGDGMLHEVVNGWFRRELVLQQQQPNENGSDTTTSGDRSSLIETPEAFDRRPFFLPFPTGSGCAVAAGLGVIDPINCGMAAIHCHWTACDSFVVKPTGPAHDPIFPKKDVVPPGAATGEALNPKNLGAGPTLILPNNNNDGANSSSSSSSSSANQMLIANEELTSGAARSGNSINVSVGGINMNNNGNTNSPTNNKSVHDPPSWDCVSWAKMKDRVPPPRLGLLSVSTGLISDVDKGSETMRYLGNARFTVEMVRKVAGTTPKYSVVCRYLPALHPQDGKPVDSIDRLTGELKFSNPKANFPEPTVLKALTTPLHVQDAPEVSFQPEKNYDKTSGSFHRSASIRQERSDRVAASRVGLKGFENTTSASSKKNQNDDDNQNDENQIASSNNSVSLPLSSTTGGAFAHRMSTDSNSFDTVATSPSKKEQQQQETPAAHENTSNSWTDFSTASEKDKTYMIMVSNITAIAKDCIFAPFARYNDGALDIVGLDGNMGKVDLVAALLKLEDGTHVEGGTKDKIKYVKAREVELEAKDGLLMCDGEIIPQCPVIIKNIPRSIKMVRTTLAE